MFIIRGPSGCEGVVRKRFTLVQQSHSDYSFHIFAWSTVAREFVIAIEELRELTDDCACV